MSNGTNNEYDLGSTNFWKDWWYGWMLWNQNPVGYPGYWVDIILDTVQGPINKWISIIDNIKLLNMVNN